MRGGLDDALEKLARRDELRRRATSEATGTPAAVTELVEAIAAVVARNPRLGVTVGVEGDVEPTVLRFYYEDGQVQVTADNSLAAQPDEAGPRHADFDIVIGEPVDEVPAQAHRPAGETQRASQDDQDRYGPAGYSYEQSAAHYGESDTAERRYGGLDASSSAYETHEDPRDLGARLRDLGMAASHEAASTQVPAHPLAATPPPPIPDQTTRRIQSQQFRAPAPPAAAPPANQWLHDEWSDTTERLVPPSPAESRVMPTPLPQPIPLRVERPEETEMAARRLAALLRDDPSLLNQRPD